MGPPLENSPEVPHTVKPGVTTKAPAAPASGFLSLVSPWALTCSIPAQQSFCPQHSNQH